MQASKLFVLPLFFASLSLTSCVQQPPKSYSAIDGNWHIAGGESPAEFPLLTLAIGVSGNSVYGEGSAAVNCSGGGSGMGSSLSVTGQIASDGTFVLSNSAFPLNSIQVTIRGKIPIDGAITWNGSYSITNASTEKSCSFNKSSDFVADLYPSLNGTYTGTMTTQVASSGMAVVTQVMQGAFTSSPRLPPNSPYYYIPLSATITVSGSPCFATGRTAASPLTSISGDNFQLSYTMNDGSALFFSGFFTDSSESSLQLQTWFVVGGKCDGTFGSGDVFTRQ